MPTRDNLRQWALGAIKLDSSTLDIFIKPETWISLIAVAFPIHQRFPTDRRPP